MSIVYLVVDMFVKLLPNQKSKTNIFYLTQSDAGVLLRHPVMYVWDKTVRGLTRKYNHLPRIPVCLDVGLLLFSGA